MEVLLLCLEIFFVRIFDVALSTVRTIITVKGKTVLASIIGFVEVLIWFLIVREALNTDYASFLVGMSYAGGYAVGTLVGGFFSEKFISGNLTVQVILSSTNDEAVSFIRKNGFAVTVLDVKGQDDVKKYMLIIEIKKKEITSLRKLIKELDDKAFIIVNETKMVQNGYFR